MEIGTLEFTAYLDSPVETSTPDVIGWWGVSPLHAPALWRT